MAVQVTCVVFCFRDLQFLSIETRYFFSRTTIMSGQFDFSSSPTLSSSQLISSLSPAQNHLGINSNPTAVSNNNNQFFPRTSGPPSFSRNGYRDFSPPAQNLGSYDINFGGDHNPHASAMLSVKYFLKLFFSLI
jgi:hypothetical protein